MKTLTIILACLAMALIAGCKPVSSASTNSGAGTIYVGWHPPLTQEGVGEWERTDKPGIPTWVWAVAGGGVGAASGAGANAYIRNHAAAAAMSFVGNPCKDKPGNYKLIRWTTPLPKRISMGEAKNPSPFLDCRSLRNILLRRAVPGRLKDMYDCIGLMLGRGNPTWSTIRNAVVWSYKDGMVAVTRGGRVVTAAPADKLWGKCAQEAGG